MTSQLYPYFCEMMELDLLDTKICNVLRDYLVVVGRDFGITSSDISSKINQGAFNGHECGAFDSSTLKINNNGAQNQLQRTCITNAVNETFPIQSKDFQ